MKSFILPKVLPRRLLTTEIPRYLRSQWDVEWDEYGKCSILQNQEIPLLEPLALQGVDVQDRIDSRVKEVVPAGVRESMSPAPTQVLIPHVLMPLEMAANIYGLSPPTHTKVRLRVRRRAIYTQYQRVMQTVKGAVRTIELGHSVWFTSVTVRVRVLVRGWVELGFRSELDYT